MPAASSERPSPQGCRQGFLGREARHAPEDEVAEKVEFGAVVGDQIDRMR
jgi:hypothetical protein